MIDPRLPVLVGVGTCLDDAEAVELMARAALAAGDDSGAPALLGAVQRVAVPRGTWTYTDPGRIVASRIRAPDAETHVVDLGIPQQTLLNQAFAAIVAGELDVALIVGGEAKARAARAAKRGSAADATGIVNVFRREGSDDEGASEIDQHGAMPDVHQTPTGEILSRVELEARLFAPVEQYALMESAVRAAQGQSIEAHRQEIADLWSRFNEVARANPEAAFPEPMSLDDLSHLGPANRPLAYPYGKWHVSQWTVDQAAALLVCSAEVADRFGVDRDRWVFPTVALDSSASTPLPKRRELHRWPAMGVLGNAASKHLGRPLEECDHVEVYSCFPVAVRVQQRELGLASGRTPTITGGMTFAGGPFNSFVLQSTVALARRLREQGGLGLQTTVSGMLTKPGLAVWATEPPGAAPLVADLAAGADAATATVDVKPSHEGEATMAACTVTYDALEPKTVIGIFDTPDGARVVARADDPDIAREATQNELVGQRFAVSGTMFG